MEGMSLASISRVETNIQSVLNNALQQTGLSANSGTPSSVNPTSAQGPDSPQLSPFAQTMSTLQKLQAASPTEYQQVTQQIATNLQNAAQTATNDGNSGAASQLNQLATDFTSASQSGQLPNIQDLAQAIGGGDHHHGSHHHASLTSSTTSTSSTSSTASSAGSSSPLDQLLAALQSNTSQSESLNPMSIILNTLSTAGLSI